MKIFAKKHSNLQAETTSNVYNSVFWSVTALEGTFKIDCVHVAIEELYFLSLISPYPLMWTGGCLAGLRSTGAPDIWAGSGDYTELDVVMVTKWPASCACRPGHEQGDAQVELQTTQRFSKSRR